LTGYQRGQSVEERLSILIERKARVVEKGQGRAGKGDVADLKLGCNMF
jgi:hypothetical protein